MIEKLLQIINRCHQPTDLSNFQLKIIIQLLTKQVYQFVEDCQKRKEMQKKESLQIYINEKFQKWSNCVDKFMDYQFEMDQKIDKLISQVRQQISALDKDIFTEFLGKVSIHEFKQTQLDVLRVIEDIDIEIKHIYRDIDYKLSAMEYKLIGKLNEEVQRFHSERALRTYYYNIKQQNRKTLQWIQAPETILNQVEITNNVIMAKMPVEILGKEKIFKSKSISFKIVRKRHNIWFGFFSAIHEENIQSFNALNVQRRSLIDNIVAFSTNGQLMLGNKLYPKTNKELYQGETIKISIDFQKCQTTWSVGVEIRQQLINNKIKMKEFIWVPYIYLESQGDSISII